MKTYFVEGEITVKVDCEIEANSLEDAEERVFQMYKDDHPMLYYVKSIENYDLTAGEFEDEDYNETNEEDE